MPVIAAIEFDHRVPPCGTSSQAQGRHARLGARIDHAHHLQGGDDVAQQLRHLDLEIGGSAKAGAAFENATQGIGDHGRSMAQDHGTPGSYVVDILLAVGIGNVSTAGIANEKWVTPHGPEGANGAVYTTRDHLNGTLVVVAGLLLWQGHLIRAPGEIAARRVKSFQNLHKRRGRRKRMGVL